MNGEYWFVRQIRTPITASPAIPAASSGHLAARGSGAFLRAGHAIASAAPSSRPNARVSVPSYTRVGSKPGR